MLNHKLVGVISILVTLFPGVTFAAEKIDPALNPLCWKQADCFDVRAQIQYHSNYKDLDAISKKQVENSWVTGEEPCKPEGWGKCLPSGVVTTEISFGGQNKFLHLGAFVQSMYKYAIGIAAILATVMIIVAGFQYVASGGNAEMITSAKKRIGGALIGLLLAYLSYAILNTLNPALTNLRLPQIWMLRGLHIVPQFCSGAPKGTLFAKAMGTEDQISAPQTPPDFGDNLSFADPKKVAEFHCGKRFYMKDGGPNACFGDYCPSGNVCVDFDYVKKPPKQKYYCQPGVLAGNIAGSLGIFGAPVVDAGNNFRLLGLCKDGDIVSINEIDVDWVGKSYTFEAGLDLEGACGKKDNLAGFYMGIEVNDETGLTGRLGEGFNGSWGTDDWHAVGQTDPGSHDCSVNLSRIAYSVLTNNTMDCSSSKNTQCSCSFIDGLGKDLRKQLAQNTAFTQHLLSLEDLKRGYLCNVTVSRSQFPAMDNRSTPDLKWYDAIPITWPIEFIRHSYNALVDKTSCD